MTLVKQPKINLPKSGLETFLSWIGLLTIIATTMYLILTYGSLPAEVPAHYNGAGEVDRWGSKAELFLLPLIAFFVIWLPITWLEKYPHTFNYLNLREDNVEFQYRNARLMMNVMKTECAILFSWLTFQDIRIAEGGADGLGPWFLPVFTVVLFGSMGIFIVRMLRA